MIKPKFKIGDRIKILRASTESEHDLWGDSWVLNMNRMIGKTVTIQKCINCDNKYKYYKYRIKEYDYSYPGFVLQDITIGKQLLFSFMSEAT